MTGLSGRIRQVRLERFGERGAARLAAELGLPVGTWLNYERGVNVPGQVLLAFIDHLGVRPHWLVTGEGEAYQPAEAWPRVDPGPVRASRAGVSGPTPPRRRWDGPHGTTHPGATDR